MTLVRLFLKVRQQVQIKDANGTTSTQTKRLNYSEGKEEREVAASKFLFTAVEVTH